MQKLDIKKTNKGSLLKILSAKRLAAYGGTSDVINFAEHSFNILLSETFYPLLQLVEIGLRNNLDQSIQHIDKEWSENNFLGKYEKQRIDTAKNDILKVRKSISHNEIISELDFGFWTGLLDSKYEQIFWPELLKKAFPYLPRKIRTRVIIQKKFTKIRKLRNRIFHHERISHLDLVDNHKETLEAIKWLSHDLHKLAVKLDRFTDLYKQKDEIVHDLKIFHGGDK